MEEFDEEKAFLAAVGGGVVAFCSLETKAAVVFASLLKAQNEAGAMNVLWRMNAFTQRIEAMDIAARWLFGLHSENRELQSQWEGLRSRLYAASELRNRLAHSEIGEMDTSDGVEFFLRQPFTDWSRIDPRKMEKGARAMFDKNVSQETVLGAASQFEKLVYDLHNFQVEVDAVQVKAKG